MIIQPDREKWNVNDIRYKNEARRIAVLNEIFGDVELSTEECGRWYGLPDGRTAR